MRLILNVFPDGICAQIYVYADAHEEAFLLNGEETRTVKIWHNINKNSMTIPFFPFQNYSNDYCIRFNSKVPFKSFCELYLLSEYEHAKNYRFLTHNCTHAALYALQLSQIKIPMTSLRKMYVPYVPIGIPVPFLTPLDLFYRTKNYKIHTLETSPLPLSKMNFKLELATSKLNFWAKSAKNKPLLNNAETIVSEINTLVRAQKENSELYLEALIKTIDLILHKQNPTANKEYLLFSKHFKKRESTSQVRNMIKQNMYLLQGAVLLGVVLCLVGLDDDWKVSVSFNLLVSMCAYGMTRAMQSERNIPADLLYKTTDTTLSLAMQNVETEMQSNLGM